MSWFSVNTGSSGDCDSLDMKLLVKDVTNVVCALEANVIGTRKVILIGHSVGGCIATFVVRGWMHCIENITVNL